MAMLNQLLDAARSNVTFFAWNPLVRLSRAAVLNLLSRVEVGYLLISDTDGSETVCGERWPKEEGPATELKVLKETFWVRLLLFADMVRNGSACFRKVLRSDRRRFRGLRKASCWVKWLAQTLSASSR